MKILRSYIDTHGKQEQKTDNFSAFERKAKKKLNADKNIEQKFGSISEHRGPGLIELNIKTAKKRKLGVMLLEMEKKV